MKIYRRAYKINYNNSLFQVIIRNDKSIGFLKIDIDQNGEEQFIMPSAQEFLHLSSVINTNNGIKF